MYSVCLSVSFVFLAASVLHSISANNQEYAQKLHKELCSDGNKLMKEQPDMSQMPEMEPEGGFYVIMGGEKNRYSWARSVKPSMELKSESDYDKMCAKLNNKKQKNGVGLMMAFGDSAAITCTRHASGCLECKVKGNAETIRLYFTQAPTVAKIYVAVLCKVIELMPGWFTISASSKFTPEEHKIIQEHVKTLGFHRNDTVTFYGDKCMA